MNDYIWKRSGRTKKDRKFTTEQNSEPGDSGRRNKRRITEIRVIKEVSIFCLKTRRVECQRGSLLTEENSRSNLLGSLLRWYRTGVCIPPPSLSCLYRFVPRG